MPERKTIPAVKHKSVLDIAFDNDIILEHICGGICVCTSCIILIKSGMKYFNRISGSELYQLKKSPYFGPEARLGCVSKIISDPGENIIIEIPEFIDSDI